MEVEVGYLSDEDGGAGEVTIRSTSNDASELVETTFTPRSKTCASFDSRQSTVAWGNVRKVKSGSVFPASPRSDVSCLTDDLHTESIDGVKAGGHHDPSPRRSSIKARNNRHRGRTLSGVSESPDISEQDNRDDELKNGRKPSKLGKDSEKRSFDISERSSESIDAPESGKKKKDKKKGSKKASRKNRKRADSLLNIKAADFFTKKYKKMLEPSETLASLLEAIETPESGDLDRGFLVRRKNACGTLQVLANKKSNQVSICWTNGVISALTSVLTDGASSDLEATFNDLGSRREYIDGRKRALASLMNLSTPSENRQLLFHSSHLVSSLVLLVKRMDEDCLRECCAILCTLTKSQEVRKLILETPRLLDAIVKVIKPATIERNPKTSVPKKEFVVENDEYHADEDTYHSSGTEENTTYADHPVYTLSSETSSTVGSESDGVSTLCSKDKRDQAKKEGSSSEEEESSLLRAGAEYDDAKEHIRAARQNVFALLAHLVKDKENVATLARKTELVEALIKISTFEHSPSQLTAVKLLVHLTRHQETTKHLIAESKDFLPILVRATFSDNDEIRKYACFAFQNLSQDPPCRQHLAITPDLLLALCARARQATDPDERLASIHALRNLTEEPANLIPMTNTPECFATLMQLAHAGDESVTEMMQYLGCDALATLSHWFRSIATSGQHMEETGSDSKSTPSNKKPFVPTLKTIPYEQWH